MTTLRMLKRFETYRDVYTVRSILREYTGQRAWAAMKDALEDMIDYWAECCTCSPEDITAQIIRSLDEPSHFKIVSIEGPGGGYPECQIVLVNGVELLLDWVIDD